MQVTVKLYATLAQHLPPGARNNQAPLELTEEEATPAGVIERLNLPGRSCHLVLVNGVYVAPGERAAKGLRAGDVVAMWPPVAGG